MRTGRKNRKKNRKSRGYIVPMCLALSGTLMAGTAAGAEQPLGEITNEYTGTPKSPDGLQWVKHNGDMVTLHNIGITNGGWDTESGHYYFSGVKADKKRITVEVDEDSNTGGVRPFSPIRSTQQGNSPYEILIRAKDFALSADFESNSPGDAKRYNTRGLFVDGQGSVTVEVSETINLKTGEFPIFADSGNITIRGFKELNAVTTGRTGGAGYVVRNVDTASGPSTIQIVSTPDSKIQLISEKSSSEKETAVVEDASSGQGTLI